MGNNLHSTIVQAFVVFAPSQSEVHREPVTHWNDDDLYEFDAHTLELFRQHSPQRLDLQHLMRGASSGVAMLHDGHSLARGAKVKHLGLWQRRTLDDVPAFLTQGATA